MLNLELSMSDPLIRMPEMLAPATMVEYFSANTVVKWYFSLFSSHNEAKGTPTMEETKTVRNFASFPFK